MHLLKLLSVYGRSGGLCSLRNSINPPMDLSEVSQFTFLTLLEVSLQYGNFLPFLSIELVLLPLIEINAWHSKTRFRYREPKLRSNFGNCRYRSQNFSFPKQIFFFFEIFKISLCFRGIKVL